MKALLGLALAVIGIPIHATEGEQACNPDVNAVITDVLNQSLIPDGAIQLPDWRIASKK
jgi:hypothetical protein